jgi:hypothetical protein
VYGLPPLAAAFAWHLFLQRIAHRRHPTADAESEAGPVPVPTAGEAATAGTVPPAEPASAKPSPVPEPATGDDPGAGPPRPRHPTRRRPTTTGTGAASTELAARARTAAEAFEADHGRPISRDALRRALRVSNRVAGELLRAVREAPPPASVPQAGAEAAVTVTSSAAGNGRRPVPGDHQPVPSSSSSPSRSPARV